MKEYTDKDNLSSLMQTYFRKGWYAALDAIEVDLDRLLGELIDNPEKILMIKEHIQQIRQDVIDDSVYH